MAPEATYAIHELRGPSSERLQAFFDANPEYWLRVFGRPPGPNDARELFETVPPPEMTWRGKHVLEIEARDGSVGAIADVITDLCAPGLWHVGLFIAATRLHGTGESAALYGALETWMRERGAAWARLGVVVGNTAAERFWKKMGYTEVKLRKAVEMKERIFDMRVMAKPLAGGTIAEYRSIMPRDDP
jgi:GNAT superfamily N-acetyltransferase